MKCPNCGTDNPENAKFCEECGNKLPVLSKESATKSGVTAKTPATSPGNGRGINTKILLLIIAIVIVVGAAAAYMILPSFFSSPQQSTVQITQVVSGSATITTNEGKTYQVTVKPTGICSGSGFIVSKDGYIATAAHVVGDSYDLEYLDKIRKMDDKDVNWYVARAALLQYYKQYLPSQLQNMTQQDLDAKTNDAIGVGVKVSDAKLDYYISGPAFPGSATDKTYVAKIVDFSATDNQEKDLALLKVDSPPANLPALTISNQKPKTGDSITIYGYPREQSSFLAAFLKSSGNQQQFLESMNNATMTKGIVSAERTSPQGTTYYQTDASVNNGNSGGPVLNTNNQVIGVLVLGFGETGNFNFFLSSQYVTDMLKKNGINV